MSTVVDQLLGVDTEARQVLDNAQQYYQETIEETQVAKESLRKKYQDKTIADIANIKNDLYKNLNEELSFAKKRYDHLEHELLEKYEQHKSEWISEILARCINTV